MSQATCYNPSCEMMPRDELEQLQIERLQSTLNRACRNVAFYRSAFDEHRVQPEKLTDLKAMRELPFTTKEDLEGSYPYGMFAVPLKDIVRIHSTSGTTGKPIVFGYTPNDLRDWAECAARLLVAGGITAHDVVQIALDYSLFPGGFGFHQGAEQIGASVIPTSLATGMDKQIVVMRDFRTTVLVSTPGHAVSIVTALEELHLHPERLHLRLGLFGGEPWSERLRQELEQRLHVATMDTYGPDEVMWPGVAGECPERSGLHVNEDHFIVEVIDAQSLQPVAPGQEGELVITTINREGFPLIRYRTGDITSLEPAPCPCGRTSVRMARVLRRTDDRVVFRGVGFFPCQVEEILLEVEGTTPHYGIVLDRAGGVDTLEIKVEVSEEIPSLDELKTLETLRRRISKRIRAALDVEANVTFVEPRSLRRLAGAKGRVVDRRTR